MEFPDDILGLIRAFSRPVFTYFREYKKAMDAFGIKDWLVLKQNFTAEVCEALMAYLNAIEEAKTFEKIQYETYYTFLRNTQSRKCPLKMKSIYETIRQHSRLKIPIFRNLTRLLYSEEKEIHEVEFVSH